MHHRAQMRVVKVEDIRRDAVDQRGVQRVELFAAADQRCGARPGELVERGERAFNRFITATAERAAHPVEQRALRLVAHRLRNVVPA